jgi:LysM repeat protein
MHNTKQFFGPRHLRLGAFAILLTASPALRAQADQPAPAASPPAAPAPMVAAMSQDVQELQRTVNQLSLQVETLQQDNQRLQQQILSPQDLNTMIQNAIAESRAETTKEISQSDADLRKDILADVAQQIEALAKDTNVQLKKLAEAISERSAAPMVAIQRTPLPPNTKGEVYTVKRGDSLAKIAQLYKISEREIINANTQIGNPDKLLEGQQLFIPLKDGATALPALTGN